MQEIIEDLQQADEAWNGAQAASENAPPDPDFPHRVGALANACEQQGESLATAARVRDRVTCRAVARRATLRYMSQPLSLRLAAQTIERLGVRARRAHLPPRTLAQRYVEEGLRMDEHPLVRFADGPAGRRPRLVGSGLDVWEAVATVRDNDGDLATAAGYLEMPLGLVQAAVAYYGQHQSEIDEWIELNEQEAAESHDAWQAGQAALQQ